MSYRKLPTGVIPLLIALLFQASAHAQAGAFGLGNPGGGGASAGGAGVPLSADPLLLDDGAGNSVELSVDGADGALAVKDPANGAASGISLYSAAGANPVWLAWGTTGGTLYVGSTKGSANGTLGVTNIDGGGAGPLDLQPGSGQTLILRDEGGDAALTVATNGALTVTTALQHGDAISARWGAGNDMTLKWSTEQTNDSALLSLWGAGGSTALIIADDGNKTADLGLTDYTDPTLVLTSATAWGSDTTEWASFQVATGGTFTMDLGDAAHQYAFKINGTDELRIGATSFTVGGRVIVDANTLGVRVGDTGGFEWTNSAGGGAGSVVASIDKTAADALEFSTGANTLALTINASQLATFEGAINYKQTAAADTTTPTLIALPTGGTAAQAGWAAFQINGATAWIPYWQ